ncbi:MAG TPA: thioredoxin family protein [Aliiroseovarius sp.]|nr:thioredoxin family protein [Aliiroseovarius sp.]
MRLLKSLATATFIALFTAPLWALELVMVEQDGCVYCEMWHEEIAEIYPKTAEGKFAPLRRVDLFELDESGVAFERGINFTPTFVVVEDGRELTRLEGYPGEDFFWFLLTKMLTETTSFTAEGS